MCGRGKRRPGVSRKDQNEEGVGRVVCGIREYEGCT